MKLELLKIILDKEFDIINSDENLIEFAVTDDNRNYFASDFNNIYNLPLSEVWNQWITFEKEFQKKNLEKIRLNPVTAYRTLSTRPLGALSRAFYDSTNSTIYAAIDFPGQVAQIVAYDTRTGNTEKIHDVKGAALYYVTSLAFDPTSHTLFYTTDNNDWRSLYSVDIKTGDEKLLLKEERIGDLVFNQADKSLWGIRHFNGQSTLVRMPHPYSEWNQIFTWPFGQDMYNIDISRDGKNITGALAEINGQQLLIRMNVESIISGIFPLILYLILKTPYRQILFFLMIKNIYMVLLITLVFLIYTDMILIRRIWR